MTHMNVHIFAPSSPTRSVSPPLTPSTSSTLISTPQLKPTVLGPNVKPRLSLSIPFRLSSTAPVLVPRNPDMTSTRGHIEPHISNLPRRRKPAKPLVVRAIQHGIADAHHPSQIKVESSSTNSHQLRSLPLLGDVKQERDLHTATVDEYAAHAAGQPGPSVTTSILTNLPRRRRKPLSPAQLIIQRAQRRCLQEVGDGSGVYVAFTEVDDEEEQESRKLRKLGGEEFARVVRVVEDDNSMDEDENVPMILEEDEWTLRLCVPSGVCHDDGNTHLDEQQLTSACRFLRRSSSPTVDPGPIKLLITTPRDRAADGMAIAVLYITATRIFVPPPPVHELPAPSLQSVTHSYLHSSISRSASTHTCYPEADSRIHALLIYLHDHSCDDLEEAHGHVSGSTTAFNGWKSSNGLRSEWHGLLSWEGIDFLETCLASKHLDV